MGPLDLLRPGLDSAGSMILASRPVSETGLRDWPQRLDRPQLSLRISVIRLSGASQSPNGCLIAKIG